MSGAGGESVLRVLRELPLVWFLIGAAFAWMCEVALRKRALERQALMLRWLALGAGLVTLAIYVGLNVAALHSFVLQNDEADILAIAAASLHGQPVYHSLTSPDFGYSLRYGPMTFLVYRPFLVWGGERFWVLRGWVFAANLLVCASLYSIFRKTLRRELALALTAPALGGLIVHMRYALGMRADLWIVLTVALAVRVALMESEMWAGVLVGVMLGLAVDLKATVAVSGLLVLVLLYRRHGWKPVAIAAGTATLTGLAPFALPGFSLAGYLAWLNSAPGGLRSIDYRLVIPALGYAAFLLAPFALLRCLGIDPLPGERGWRKAVYWVVIVSCVLAVAFIAAKPGTGMWHFWQLIPVLCGYLALALGQAGTVGTRRATIAVLAIALGGMAVGLSFLRRDIALVRRADGDERELKAGRTELDKYLDEYPGRTVQVGYGGWGPAAEWLRYIPVLRGQPYTLDGSLRLEEFFEKFPSGVIEKMNHCTNDVWLIPHGGAPFVFGYVFPAELNEAFVKNYAMERQGEKLDAWTCKAR
jgi:hypothetical protein